jgi:hypothetical protein
VIGYHGTSESAAASVLLDGFQFSRNDYDWLGDGVYFFQDAPLRAWEWARQQHGDAAAVIRSMVRLEDCLDLVDIAWNAYLKEAYLAIVDAARRTGTPLPRQTIGAHRLDRAVVNYAVGFLAERGIVVRTVRGAFAEGNPVFPGSAILNRSHIQIAIRDQSLIETSDLLATAER